MPSGLRTEIVNGGPAAYTPLLGLPNCELTTNKRPLCKAAVVGESNDGSVIVFLSLADLSELLSFKMSTTPVWTT